MKTITTTINGLASSLFLNVGLTRLAQKLDPVSHGSYERLAEAHGPAITAPCSFTPKARR
jgi:hypothetical protein